MREAVITQLKTITEFSNRVYQAYTPLPNTTKPYCTVKLAGEYPTPQNKRGSMMDLQIFIYNTPSSFTTLDSLETKVKQKLHNVTLSIDDSPPRYFTAYYNMTQPDFFDDVTGLFMKRVDFFIPLARA